MDSRLKSILKALGLALLLLLLVNVVSFCFALAANDWQAAEWQFRFKHGAFFINGEPHGILFGTNGASLFILAAFAFFYWNDRSGNKA